MKAALELRVESDQLMPAFNQTCDAAVKMAIHGRRIQEAPFRGKSRSDV